ncbi:MULTISPECIES: MFS transporter [Mucilaginibacter]|uniref:MFS transporter n=1 Tax=Mucilaginibacter rubeus TaxID=2027860 RepID=A0AAE6JGV6_9SPHI|nr:MULTISPECIES: MFS transporter [Mucilaginibacter]QEM04517.1 MFS transporter [Mucilaginibacter rubeus]QEM17111.1 MFS transporter [Mucilaginibacter gossypii]QTE46388.1 MFS transporter [Mucilaginibacter rubeus]QTE52985.1 MFS transporter [Mucilaginibacter rubeus]QTE58071.1 MFS transporter [Mucilaginibacter rubeus]
MQTINRTQLFRASCLSLLVTSLSFGIRAGILNDQGVRFHLNASQLGTIAATAFWGFPLAIIVGGFIVDIIGMKKLLVSAFVFHLVGILLTIFANGYWTLFLSTLMIGIANGTVEASCNPLVASLYTDNKTTKLNHFHLWFPAGIVIGTLIVFGLDTTLAHGVSPKPYWISQVEIALMLIPTIAYGYLFSKLDFPVTERVSAGVSTEDMYKALINPLFLFMIICMFGTAITELFTNQWTDVLFKTVTDNAILILTFVASVQVLGRAFASPIVHRLAPQGVLLISAILSALGIYLMVHLHGDAIYFAAVVFGLGVAFFWPCMIGFVAENLPRTGAVGLNLMGGAGMFGVSIYMMFMGGFYDKIMASKLPAGASLDAYRSAPAGSDMAKAFDAARSAAGPEVLNTTLIIPIALIVAFIGLVIYMRSRKKTASLGAISV